MAVFIVSNRERNIKQVSAPEVRRNKSSRMYLFYGKENGERVRLPSPSSSRIIIEDLLRGRKKDEPISWENDYEVVVTRMGYVLVGSDVRRGLVTGINEYPVYWYDSLASAREDYYISSVSLMPKEKEETDEPLRSLQNLDAVIKTLEARSSNASNESD